MDILANVAEQGLGLDSEEEVRLDRRRLLRAISNHIESEDLGMKLLEGLTTFILTLAPISGILCHMMQPQYQNECKKLYTTDCQGLAMDLLWMLLEWTMAHLFSS